MELSNERFNQLIEYAPLLLFCCSSTYRRRSNIVKFRVETGGDFSEYIRLKELILSRCGHNLVLPQSCTSLQCNGHASIESAPSLTRFYGTFSYLSGNVNYNNLKKLHYASVTDAHFDELINLESIESLSVNETQSITLPSLRSVAVQNIPSSFPSSLTHLTVRCNNRPIDLAQLINILPPSLVRLEILTICFINKVTFPPIESIILSSGTTPSVTLSEGTKFIANFIPTSFPSSLKEIRLSSINQRCLALIPSGMVVIGEGYIGKDIKNIAKELGIIIKTVNE